MLSKRAFNEFCRGVAAHSPFQGLDYFLFHDIRLWKLYELAASVVGPSGGRRVLSVGAGSAYVEAALAASEGAAVTVVDFPATVDSLADYYDALDITAVGADLSAESPFEHGVEHTADLVISSEIVEHLPRPPEEHFSILRRAVRTGGSIIVGTPNAGSLPKIVRTIRHIPTLPPPALTFGPVDVAHEAVHRREYMRREIAEALASSGFTLASCKFAPYSLSRGTNLIVFLAEPVPLLRECMLVLGHAV